MNVVCICADTFRYDLVGPGHKLSFVETPNLDQLQSESIVLDRAYGEAQATIQMRLAFFTGHRTFPYSYNPPTRGTMNACLGWHPIPDCHASLPEIFFDHGYVTGLVSDVFHMFKPNMNFHRGFMHWDFIRGQEADPVHCGPTDVDISPHVPAGQEADPMHAGLRQYLIGIQDRRCELDYFTPRVFNRAIRFLEDNHRRPPLFLWIDSFAPHEYWDPPMHFADRYFADPSAKNYILPQINQTADGPQNRTAADIERTKALYYGYVTFLDKWIGVFLNKLDELRLLDDTLVLFVSDHGTELMDNGIFSKNLNGPRNYNHQIPFFMRLPGKQYAGTHVDPVILSHDLPATLLDIAGIDPPEPIEGQSAMPLVRGDKDKLHTEPIITGWTDRACVRDREWAYIIDTVRADQEAELYHTAVDPYETTDVAADHPDIVKDRRRRLEEFLGSGLPVTYGHKPDRRNIMTLGRHLEIRRQLGMET